MTEPSLRADNNNIVLHRGIDGIAPMCMYVGDVVRRAWRTGREIKRIHFLFRSSQL